MSELEDLRDRSFEWKAELRSWRECHLVEDGRTLAVLRRTSFWKGRYAIHFAGVDWTLGSKMGWRCGFDKIGFRGASASIASARETTSAYEAIVDGASTYRFVLDPETPGRVVCRDAEDLAMVAFTSSSRRGHSTGTIRVFQACPVEQAPVLLLLGLRRMVYGGTASAASLTANFISASIQSSP